MITTHLRNGEATILQAFGVVQGRTIWRPILLAASSSRIRKALDPNKEKDFILAVEQETRTLDRKTKKIIGDFYDEVLGDELDADWVDLPADHRNAVLNQAVKIAESEFPVAAIQAAIAPHTLAKTTSTMNKSASTMGAAFDLPKGITWGGPQKDLAAGISEASYNYVSNLGSGINQAASKTAKQVVSEGIKAGLGREELGLALHEALGSTVSNQSLHYWRTVAGSYMGRARTAGNLLSMQKGGLKTYEILAVLDNVTTPTCRYLHGKRFQVGQALGILGELSKMKKPTDIKTSHPWIQVHGLKGQPGLHSLKVPTKRAGLVTIATETSTGFGSPDEIGTWDTKVKDDQLFVLNIGPPPYHGGCRTTIFPVIPGVTKVLVLRFAGLAA